MRNHFVLVLILAMHVSCSTSSELAPSVREELERFKNEFGDRWAVDTTPDGRYITSLTGAPAGGAPPLSVATAARSLTGFPEVVFSQTPVLSSLGAIRQMTWPQIVDGKIVENAGLVLQYWQEGGPVDVILNVAVPEAPLPREVRTAEEARKLAETLVKREVADPPRELSPRLANLDAEASTLRVTAELRRPHSYYLAHSRRVRLVYDVLVRATVGTQYGPHTVVLRELAIDAASDSENPGKAIVRTKDLMSPAVGIARGFDPNPINTLNLLPFPLTLDLKLMQPPYFEHRLRGLNESTSADYSLSGTYVEIAEREGPPSVPSPVHSPLGTPDFTFTRGGAEFAAANAYYHVDSMARWIAETLMISDTVPLALQVDVRSGGFSPAPDAAYVRDDVPYLWFSVTSLYKIFVAEDGDAIAHEYAHAVLEHTTDGFFTQGPAVRDKVEARAINEGFADYWALSTFSQQAIEHNHTLDCFMEWANEGRCLRTYSPVMHGKFNAKKKDQQNGQIWSGTLYKIFKLLKNDRQLADSIILKGHLLRARKDAPTMKSMADGIIIAAWNQPPNTIEQICKIFKENEFDNVTCCVQVGCSGPTPQ